jgi:hypothetical protein
MLEQLFNLVREQSSELVVNNPQIPNEHNHDVMAEATSTVFSGLQNMAAGGGLQNILQLFNNNRGGAGSNGIAGLLKNPIVNMMIGHFANKLTGKYNVNSNQASGIAGQLIPSILSNLVQRTNDPNNSSFDLNGILGALSGGGQQAGGFDIGSLVSKVGSMGGDVDGDGDADMQDMIARFTQGAQQQQVQRGGGIFDLLKGFAQ